MLLHLWIIVIKALKNTWNNICSEICCIVGVIPVDAAEEDDGVGKRRRRPSRVTSCRHAVIEFDKEDDCGGLLSFVDIFVEFDKY